MITTSLAKVLSRVGKIPTLSSVVALGVVIAIGVSMMPIFIGAIVHALDAEGNAINASSLGSYLPNLASYFEAQTKPMARLSILLLCALAFALFLCLLLYVFYRSIQSTAVNFELFMIGELRRHARRLATARTLSAQQQALADCLNYHLPRVRVSLARYWRTMPRHLIQLSLCLVVACTIQPVLLLVALLGTGIVLLWYWYMDRLKRTQLPVVRERAAHEREELVEICLKGPLIESVHDQSRVDQSFDEQVNHYRVDAARSLTSSVWKTPTLVLGSIVLASLLLFVAAIQILSDNNSMGLGAGAAFACSFCFAGISLARIQGMRRELRTVDSAAAELDHFLSLTVIDIDEEQVSEIDRISQQVELDHVTVTDSKGRKLLEDLSVTFSPGQLIGLVATNKFQTHALAELLLGLGRPTSGRMLFDGHLVTDLSPTSLTKCAHWITQDGALITGTLIENLYSGDVREKRAEMEEVIKACQLSEMMMQLNDGLTTLLTPDDDRLKGDDGFRIGVARAALTDASIFLVEEPKSHFDENVEHATLDAIRQLVRPDAITVVLAQRLATVRECDTVVMIDDHRVSGIGKHSELIQSNELYRHLTYLRFNQFSNGRH